MKELSSRLKAIADQVISGSVMVDVGTDHAYLPVYLVSQRICPQAIGVEINPGPLQSARDQVESAGLSHRIMIREGNGLQAIRPGEAQVAVLAGMGGKTICAILEAAPEVLAGLKRLIFQPMGADLRVREWLLQHAWDIIREDLIQEDGIFYIIITAEPRGNRKILEKTGGRVSRLELEVGPDLIRRKHPLLPQYLGLLIEREQRVLAQLERSNNPELLEQKERRRERIDGLKRLLAVAEDKGIIS